MSHSPQESPPKDAYPESGKPPTEVHSPQESPPKDAYPESGKPPAKVHSPQESPPKDAYPESGRPPAVVLPVHPNNPPTTKEYPIPSGADVPNIAEPVVAYPDPSYHPVQANVSSKAGNPFGSLSASNPPDGYPQAPASPKDWHIFKNCVYGKPQKFTFPPDLRISNNFKTFLNLRNQSNWLVEIGEFQEGKTMSRSFQGSIPEGVDQPSRDAVEGSEEMISYQNQAPQHLQSQTDQASSELVSGEQHRPNDNQPQRSALASPTDTGEPVAAAPKMVLHPRPLPPSPEPNRRHPPSRRCSCCSIL
ncbi:hypothetical protein QQP08_005556 [Theobroma cacao]|nr:hypothetical protein QQP08_005556 [Theobroma cacao]